jgi:hypothetical protein
MDGVPCVVHIWNIADGNIGPRCDSTCGFPFGGRYIQQGEKETEQMHVVMGVAFSLILVAPFFGRWRANVWLRANMPEEQTAATSVGEIA